MTASHPHWLGPRRRLRWSDFPDTAVAPQPVPCSPLRTDEGMVAVDTRSLRYVPPESADAEERRAIAVRKQRAEHLRLERTKARRLVAYLLAAAVVLTLSIAASHAYPAPWGYGWQP